MSTFRFLRGADAPSGFESIELEQQHFLADLQQRGAKLVRVLYPRTANNEKELTVFR